MVATQHQTGIVEFPAADGPPGSSGGPGNGRRAAAASRTGARRSTNEDRWLVVPAARHRPLLVAVADGVGGEAAGERASGDALAALEERWRSWQPSRLPTPADARDALLAAARAADGAVRRLAASDRRLARAATTLTAAAIVEDQAVIASAGDSRAYVLGGHTVRQVTQDHSWVEEQVAAGELSVAEAAQHPMRHVITRFLGMPGGCEFSPVAETLAPDDWLLLCTDGVSNVVDESGLALARGRAAAGPADAVRALIEFVKLANGGDDATVVIAGQTEVADQDPFGLRAAPRLARSRRPLVRGALLAAGATALGAAGVWLVPRAVSVAMLPFRVAPEPAATRYLDRWAAADYGALYGMLTRAARGGFSQEVFVRQHQDMAAEMTLTHASFRLTPSTAPQRLSQQRHVPFEALFATARFGELRRANELPLLWDDGAWRVDWSPALLLPELTNGRTLRALPDAPSRGSLQDGQGRPLALTAAGGQAAPRTYPQGTVAGPLVGFVGEVSADELKDLAAKGYVQGDRVGKQGLEAAAEPILSGQRGGRLVVVAPTGELASTLASVPARPGEGVVVSLDLDLQREAEAALGSRLGSVVVLDPTTGAVRALATYPRYDPNAFITGEGVAAILNDANRPLVNRPAQGLYPPGSIFKVITMAAALEKGAFTPQSEFTCTGRWTGLPGVSMDCWLKTGHGRIDFVSGLTQSCDVVFYEVGKRLDEIDQAYLPAFAGQCGLGSPTGCLAGEEPSGTVPGPDWKQATLKEPWTRGDAVNMAIGQGQLLVTPLQMATIYTSIAAGQPRAPHLLERALLPGGNVERGLPPPPAARFPWQPSTFQASRSGLKGVVGSPNGTAAFVFQGSPLAAITAGKTGTAESGAGRPTHAWFACFAPFDTPKAVVLAMLEHAGEGSVVAAPLARRVLEIALR